MSRKAAKKNTPEERERKAANLAALNSMVQLMGRGGKRENAGRPKSGKVKLTVHVLPETKAALGERPGEAIDALVAQDKLRRLG